MGRNMRHIEDCKEAWMGAFRGRGYGIVRSGDIVSICSNATIPSAMGRRTSRIELDAMVHSANRAVAAEGRIHVPLADSVDRNAARNLMMAARETGIAMHRYLKGAQMQVFTNDDGIGIRQSYATIAIDRFDAKTTSPYDVIRMLRHLETLFKEHAKTAAYLSPPERDWISQDVPGFRRKAAFGVGVILESVMSVDSFGLGSMQANTCSMRRTYEIKMPSFWIEGHVHMPLILPEENILWRYALGATNVVTFRSPEEKYGTLQLLLNSNVEEEVMLVMSGISPTVTPAQADAALIEAARPVAEMVREGRELVRNGGLFDKLKEAAIRLLGTDPYKKW